MRRIKDIFTILAAAVMIMFMVGCSSDVLSEGTPDGPSTPDTPSKETTQVSLSIGVAGNNATRATDGNAEDYELMNDWVVVVTDNDGKVVKMLAGVPGNTENEEDVIISGGSESGSDQTDTGNGLKLELNIGDTYNFYSFANIAPDNVGFLLGLTYQDDKSQGSDFPTPDYNKPNDVIDIPTENITGTVVDKEKDGNQPDGSNNVRYKPVAVNGNDFNTGATDNGFGREGIPMSNKQTITVSADTKDINLIVVRMLAKINLILTNNTGRKITLNKVTITNITSNPKDDNNNLLLFPKMKKGQGDMDAIHSDIEPNLVDGVATSDFVWNSGTITLDTEQDIANGKHKCDSLTLYINESVAPADQNFELILSFDNGEYRYGVINNENWEGHTGEWNYIARNDYRIIPITLDDYKLELVPYDFPPIGVLPASEKLLDMSMNLWELTFHDYGHFHLVPKVTKGSDNSDVPFSKDGKATGVYWTLVEKDWSKSWFTTGTGFYEDNTPSPAIDESDNGGNPVLDTETTWNNFSPFIFAKIAKPTGTDAKTIYHEFKIKLHTDAYERFMIYRCNVVLSGNRMASGKRGNAPRRPHDF